MPLAIVILALSALFLTLALIGNYPSVSQLRDDNTIILGGFAVAAWLIVTVYSLLKGRKPEALLYFGTSFYFGSMALSLLVPIIPQEYYSLTKLLITVLLAGAIGIITTWIIRYRRQQA